MKSYLKQGSIELLGDTLELRELSAHAQVELLELHRAGKKEQTAALVAKHGVIAWQQEAIEEIERNVPAKALNEIAVAVYKLSGISPPTKEGDEDDDEPAAKKNESPSVSDLNGASSSASQPS